MEALRNLPINIKFSLILFSMTIISILNFLTDSHSKKVILLIIGLGVVIFGFIFVSKFITQPIKKYSKFAKKIEEYDFREDIEIHGTDEIGNLGTSLKVMRYNLKKIINQISSNSLGTASAAEEFASSAEQVNVSTNQIAETIEEIARSGENLSQLANNTKSDTFKLIESIKNVASSSKTSSESAQRASTVALRGAEASSAANTKIMEIKNSVDLSGKGIEELGRKSDEIGKVLDVINEISEQTNLLALNAAIEAARAGEAGKGFAVVADEVRKLAEESKKATKQIGDIIGDIASSVKNAVKFMEKGKTSVAEGSDVIITTLMSLELISSQIGSVAKDVEKISKETQDQIGYSEKVQKSISDVSSVAEESAAGSEEVSASVEEAASSMEQVTDSSKNLVKTAEDLKNVVAQFKL